jgi:hypothetical protein
MQRRLIFQLTYQHHLRPLDSGLAALDAAELMVLAEQHQPALELARRSITHDEQQLLLAERRLGLRQAGLSLETERKSSAERYHGFGIDISPPLFDSGAAEIAGTGCQTATIQGVHGLANPDIWQ